MLEYGLFLIAIVVLTASACIVANYPDEDLEDREDDDWEDDDPDWN